jgi:hypothetical protein
VGLGGERAPTSGIGAHHQNGIAEKKVRDIQENARTMMLHAAINWAMAMSVSLWPYAIRVSVDVMNGAPRVDNSKILPIEKFTSTVQQPRLKDYHTFGCPVYVLSKPRQTGKAQSKWLSRARLGIYLGMSPKHARSIALVLNTRTGLVSPQWLVKFVDKFTSVLRTSDVTHGHWKGMAGFLKVGKSQDKSHVRGQVTSTTNSTIADRNVNAQHNTTMEDQLQESSEEYNVMQPTEGATVPPEITFDMDLDIAQPKNDNFPMEFGTSLDDDTIIWGQQEDAPTVRRSTRERSPSWKVRENADRG